MTLRFELRPEVEAALAHVSRLEHPRGVAQVDAKGVATITRLAAAAPPTPDEIQIELIPKNGRWVVVTDAWFFKEGEGWRWNKARYGEFRVMPDGKALLVGLADKDLARLGNSSQG